MRDLHTIERWDDATGKNLVEEIASVGDFLVAMQTYLAAVRRWPTPRSRCATGRGCSSGAGRINRGAQGAGFRKRECRTQNTPAMVRPAPIETGQPFPICS